MQTIIISSKSGELRSNFISDNYSFSEVDGNSMVIESVDGKKISIAQARELIKFASLRPRNSKQKVAIIKDAQFLTVEAQNSLLKLIEEPMEYLQIILSVDDPKNLIDTVLSRCILVRLGDGESISPSDFKMPLYEDFLDILSMDVGSRFDWFTSNQAKFKDRKYAVEVLSAWEFFLRNFLVSSTGAISVVPEIFDKNKVIEVSNKFSSKEWLTHMEYLSDIKTKIGANNANISLGIESFLINFPVVSK